METDIPPRNHRESTGSQGSLWAHGYSRRAKSAKERTLEIGRKAVSALAPLGQNAAEPGRKGQLAAGSDSSPLD